MLSPPRDIWAVMPFWGVSKGQDVHADSKPCSLPCSGKPNHPALRCHFCGRLLPPAVTSEESGENTNLPQPLSRVTYLVWSLFRVQSSRLPPTPIHSMVKSMLSKQTFSPYPTCPRHFLPFL